MKCVYKITLLAGIWCALFAVNGCSDSGSKDTTEYLIRVGGRVLTVGDFNKAFEIARAAYPHRAMQPAALRAARFRLLNQMTEELILLERAKELGLTVSEAEVEKVVAERKSDYPEGVFEQTLLEYAVPYDTWKEGIRTRLLMNKVIAVELNEKVTITAEDISKYYEQHLRENALAEDMKDNSGDIDEVIVRNLRRKKLEEAYASWIKALQKKYPPDINQVQWEKIVAS